MGLPRGRADGRGTTPTRAPRAARSWSPTPSAARSSRRRRRRTRVASARAGNVIGGGDWAVDRLVPDIMRAALEASAVRVRNPDADPALAARAQPAQRLSRARRGAAGVPRRSRAAGTSGRPTRTRARCGWIVERIAERWDGELSWGRTRAPIRTRPAISSSTPRGPRSRLGWRPGWDLGGELDASSTWYRALRDGGGHPRVTARADRGVSGTLAASR